jgi:hypothetical protein
MDLVAVMELIVKAANVVSTLIDVGKNAAPAIKVITDLATGAASGDVTDEQLASTEATLDRMIADFNEPMD